MKKTDPNIEPVSELIHFFSELVTPQRLSLINKVLDYRTRYLTVVLEDIYQSQNASAVLRTCECFGIQDIHIIENKNKYNLNPDVALGSFKWLTLHRHNKKKHNSLSALHYLKDKGYQVVATTPSDGAIDIENLSIDEKTAIFFGTELNGLSPEILNHADVKVKLPLYGFTESFNISVSVALVLQQLVKKMHMFHNIAWQLSNEERNILLLDWLKKSVRRPSLLESAFYKRKR